MRLQHPEQRTPPTGGPIKYLHPNQTSPPPKTRPIKNLLHLSRSSRLSPRDTELKVLCGEVRLLEALQARLAAAHLRRAFGQPVIASEPRAQSGRGAAGGEKKATQTARRRQMTVWSTECLERPVGNLAGGPRNS